MNVILYSKENKKQGRSGSPQVRELKVIDPLKDAIDRKTKLSSQKVIHFPAGLPAFEHVKDFVLINNKEEAPFLWLQATEQPDLAFVTVDPFLICPEYAPEISQDDLDSLKVKTKEDVFILSIVNMKAVKEQQISANLVGIILVNWKAKLAKQVIIKNHQDYSVKHLIV